MGKRVQYIRTAGEKQLFCAFRTDFGAKRYGTPQAVHFYIYRSHCSCFPPASAHNKKRAGQRLLGEVRLIFLLGYLQQCCLFSSSFYIPFIAQRGLHLGADLTKIGAGLLCALQNRLHLRFLLCGQAVILCQQLRVALDDGQRRFQLVGQLNDLLPLPLLHGPLLL